MIVVAVDRASSTCRGTASSASCRRWARCTPATRRSSRAARAESRRARREPLRQPRAVRATPSDLAAYPRDFERDAAIAEGRGRRRPLRAARTTRCTRPASRPGSSPRASPIGLEGAAPAGPLPRRRDRVPEALQHRPPAARLVRAQGRAAGRRAEAARARPEPRRRDPRRRRRCATTTASRCRRATRASRPSEREQALAIPRALATRDRRQARAVLAPPASSPTTSRSPTSTAPPSPSPRASARRG